MSDLIYRQEAITAICEDGTWLESQGCTEITMCERKQRDADILSELPTIDAVEVVRCKDCIWKYGTDCTRFAEVRVSPEDYCSRGEAKTKRSRNEKEQS